MAHAALVSIWVVGWSPRTVDLRLMSDSKVVWWSVAVPEGSNGGGKFRQNWFFAELCHHFPAKVAAYCGGA